MERLEKLINILKITPHRQPDLVKEATHRILSRSIRSDQQTKYFLKPLIEILIFYCDEDDSAQRSVFNDLLNCVLSTFQYQNYKIILLVLLDVVHTNGTVRSVTAALQRIPHLIRNVKPVELGCEPKKLLKALIEVARRSDDESVLKGLDSTLECVMSYLDYHVRKSREMKLLLNTLVEILLRNLQSESSQTKRLAASSIAVICRHNDLQSNISKLMLLAESNFVGFCLCAKAIPQLAEREYPSIIQIIIRQIEACSHESSLMATALETLREMFNYEVDTRVIDQSAELIVNKFLTAHDTKIMLQANALACISSMIRQKPSVLDQHESLFQFRNHLDVAVRNQLTIIIGNYIEASWRFPLCLERSVDCLKMKRLWTELTEILRDEKAHLDTLKCCVVAIKSCLNTLLASDHCTHIVEYQDFDSLIQLYLKSNFKPLKIEVLSLFATLNYRNVYFLEYSHWNKLRSRSAGSLISSLQERIINAVIASLVDEYQRVRVSATSCLISMIPNIYSPKYSYNQNCDPIVALAHDLSTEHIVVLGHASDNVSTLNLQGKSCIRAEYEYLSSSIISHQISSKQDQSITQTTVNTSMNLMHIVDLLKAAIDESINQGKTAISSIVYTLHEISLVYPVYQYYVAWDCRPSENCECYKLLNFILTYLENLSEPDIVVEDLQAYNNFLALAHKILYALCHESVLTEYENKKIKSNHKRQSTVDDDCWSELVLKHTCLETILEYYFTHLIKLLKITACIIEERKPTENVIATNDEISITKRALFNRVYKKLDSSYKSSKKSLNQHSERFYQILETCLTSTSSLLEYVSMIKSSEYVKDILGYLKIISPSCSLSSIICARQLLKSLFGINIIALHQSDIGDHSDNDFLTTTSVLPEDDPDQSLHGVYHHLIANPYRLFSNSFPAQCSQITPTSDKSLASLTYKTRSSLIVRRRIEERVKSLFEHNYLASSKIKQIGESLKNIIAEFTPIVIDSMNEFKSRGFIDYQSEVLHFMSHLILLRVNYQKLALANELINSINSLLDQCCEEMFLHRESGIEFFLKCSFTFLTLLSYERGPSQPMFHVATVIQKLDDLRAKLSMNMNNERDMKTYLVPLVGCLIDDLFIYRTRKFQLLASNNETVIDNENAGGDQLDRFEIFDAERETVAQKLLDLVDDPKVYNLISVLIIESRQNSDQFKYKKFSQNLLAIISTMLSKRSIHLTDFKYVESTRKIIENISPEVFQPDNFIIETLLGTEKPKTGQEFADWMSLVLITMHILITQTKEEVFLTRLHMRMSDEAFVKYLLQVVQLCMAKILTRIHFTDPDRSRNKFIVQQLASYMLYLTHMFQSGFFYQLSRSAEELIKRKPAKPEVGANQLQYFCKWSRDPSNEFSLAVCEKMFYSARLIYPDLTIYWCNIMMLLNNVDCSSSFWRNLLVYDCQNCDRSLDDKPISENQSLSPYIELTRRGVLCLVLDFVSITMNDNVENITWLVANHINDIVKWSYETPVTEFINAVHGNSASSGIFIQAVNSNFNSMTISCVTRLLWTLQQVHYTQYGSLVVLLVEKLLCSKELIPYRSLTKNIEQFACNTVQKLLNETNRNLVVTKDEVLNQLLPEDIDRIKSLLDAELYPVLTKLLSELRETNHCDVGTAVDSTDDEDSDNDEIDTLYFKAKLIFWLAEQNCTANISSLLPALETIKSYLSDTRVVERVNKDQPLICSLVSAIYSLALTILPPPTRLIAPKFWSSANEVATTPPAFSFEKPLTQRPPDMLQIDSKRPMIKSEFDVLTPMQKKSGELSKEDMIEACRTACLKGLFLFENIDYLQDTFSYYFPDIIICLSRLPLLNAFILTPPSLWRQNVWPINFDPDDEYKINFPMVTHDILAKDPAILDNFCQRLLKLGWINRRQFEEAVMSLLGVLSNTEDTLISCKMISSITKLIRNTVGKKSEQSFDSRVIELTKAIGSNLSSLTKRTQDILDISDCKTDYSPFSSYLVLPAQKLRMMQDTVAIDDQVDVESCIRLLLNIYKLKLQQFQSAPPLTTAICSSIIALSDMFTDYEQFDWLFETFVQLFNVAERNEDRIQMQSIIIGLCKSVSVCCYEIPNELTTTTSINQKDVMFEKCRQSIDKCIKSDFGPLKLDALFGAYYMLEDSINIVASGAWELDHFKLLRQSRLVWIFKLMPIILEQENSKLLTVNAKIIQLLNTLCEVVIESESKVNLK